MDRIEAMRAFCRIVELGSFSGAAESLNLASTTISGQIQALERVLEVKLLHRSTRKVYPTNEGAAYYQRARKVIEDIDDLESSVSMSRGVARGRVVVEMPTAVAIYLIIPELQDFGRRYPEISLEVGCSERTVGLMQEGVDCAIRGGEIADQELIAHPLGLMRFCLCASANYLQSRPPITQPTDLVRHQHLRFKFPGTGKRYMPRLRHADESYPLSQTPHLVFNNASAITAATVAGLGIAAVPRAEVEHLLQTGALIELLPDWELDSMPLSLVYPPTHQLSKRVQAFAKWVSEMFDTHPLWHRNAMGVDR
ncbi:LysR family transcriptional regulator [Diaphorobacter caeni]|uniref:LysR family transcriptional regulator n=1 Tax=Diaphorobacter caeni TaxID=2784387 RepID=UPI001E647AF7|nr:LysR family transcriptional regulator [Diaphorobacter caeni]